MAGFVKCIAATAVVTAIISSVGCEKKTSGRPVTAEQYAAIKSGMTIEEVESLFDKAQEYDRSVDWSKTRDGMRRWGDSESWIDVNFRDGKVAGNQSQIRSGGRK